MHPETAAEYGIAHGEPVRVRTQRGAVVFHAEVADTVAPGVVHCVHGWAEAEINRLTDDAHLDPISGFPPFKSGLCRVEPV
jgi:anaerobic selenocysteine-containing dehydrogenase